MPDLRRCVHSARRCRTRRDGVPSIKGESLGLTEVTMQIGEPLRTIVVEPLELPVCDPLTQPDTEPAAQPEAEPEQVPAER